MPFGEILREQPVEEKEEKTEISVPDEIFVDTGYNSPRPEDEGWYSKFKILEDLQKKDPNLMSILISAVNKDEASVAHYLHYQNNHLHYKSNPRITINIEARRKIEAFDGKSSEFLVGAAFMYEALKQSNDNNHELPKIGDALKDEILTSLLMKDIQTLIKNEEQGEHFKTIDSIFETAQNDFPNIYKNVVIESYYSSIYHNTGALYTFALLKTAEEEGNVPPTTTENDDTPPSTPNTRSPRRE